MRTHVTEFAFTTTGELEFIDVTEHVQDAVDASGIRHGQATVLAPTARCSLVVNERESGLLSDLRRTVTKIDAPNDSARRALLGSASVVLPVVDGQLRLGTWQRVLLVELDDAADRSVLVQIVGE